MKKVQAKIDTATDHSLISKTIVQDLNLTIEPLTKEDPVFLLLPDDRSFTLAGKVTIRFHGANPRTSQPAFRFGKYENVATFYVPADKDISFFDAYIGADIIHEHQLLKRHFFSSYGQQNMADYDNSPQEVKDCELQPGCGALATSTRSRSRGWRTTRVPRDRSTQDPPGHGSCARANPSKYLL